MSDSVRPQRRQPTRLRRPWDSPGKNTGVGCHFLLQCMKVKVKSCRLLATPWTAAYQAPLSMGFSRQEYWSGVPLPSATYSTYGNVYVSVLLSQCFLPSPSPTVYKSVLCISIPSLQIGILMSDSHCCKAESNTTL